jgi:hypothetical protein
MTADPLPEAAQAPHLTGALRRAGALGGDARVAAVTVASARPTILSRIIRLRLAYEGAAAGAPASLILKTGHPERADATWQAGRHEVAFYAEIAARMPVPLVPRCFEAAWDAGTNAWHLLLEDLTETHAAPTPWPLPPTIAQCERIMAARARFHAQWWDDPRLGVSIGTWRPADDPQIEHFAAAVARFADRMGDRLPPERRALYERLIEAAPRLNRRYHSHRAMTIVQGDAHVWNVFMPKAEASDDLKLFDWDSWRLDTATDDLAYMMAIHWYPDRRRLAEGPLLDHYHRALQAHGVSGYDRRALDDDYRLSVLWQIATPVWQAAHNIPPWIWWNNLERICLAVDDLHCRDLLTA